MLATLSKKIRVGPKSVFEVLGDASKNFFFCSLAEVFFSVDFKAKRIDGHFYRIPMRGGTLFFFSPVG